MSSSLLSATFWPITRVLLIFLFVLNCTTIPWTRCHDLPTQHVAIRESLLLISTLDGSLHAVGQRSGIVKWTISDVPILQMSPIANLSEDAKHLILPDPKDGSLYLLNGLSEQTHRTLEKLPFNINELVSTSPCRSSDGMIYTTKKSDEWIVVDMITGEKMDVISGDSPMCPTQSNSADHLTNSFESKSLPNMQHNMLHLFKSEYQVSVFNSETREKLSNFTFVDFSPSIRSTIGQNAYDYVHLASSTNGKLATIDVTNGGNTFLWSQQFSSPIVAMYKLTDSSSFPIINRVPFLTIGGFINISDFFHHNSLFHSVFIGELANSKSLYALSALVDYSQIRKDSNHLIEGPKNYHLDNINKLHLFGYYEYPKTTNVKFSVIKKSELISVAAAAAAAQEQPKVIGDDVANTIILPGTAAERAAHLENYTSLLTLNFIILIICIIVLVIVVSSVIAYFYLHNKDSTKTSLFNKRTHQHNKNIIIGKISYNPSDIIGRGCAGTCVYKGLFENRQQVAVKRIVSDCFQLANREIELLRKLQHPHLIRYFATEHDHQFLYIAIELAELTLAEYIEKRLNSVTYEFDWREILYQSCLGLSHLHSLNIVHRDIKPQNILISLPISPNFSRKIMISDFGVSKILNSESLTTDFSAGTEGWIAPEILNAKLDNINLKASKPNDIFSMGCLIYYTYTNGEHPFGDLLSRQSNIINGKCDLNRVNGEEDMCIYSLVEAMVELEPKKRPPIEVVVKHPLFWSSKQSLQFLQDVSDRIEGEKSFESAILDVLEKGSLDVCRGDWRQHLSYELQEDLRKFRTYRGTSVRELLRAIRNKRHHYHELDAKLQSSLGSIPHEFVAYFTEKFPRLIIHSYIAMQICREEGIFQNYYHQCKLTEADRDNDDGQQQQQFVFKPLPRSGIIWFDKQKEERDRVKLSPFDTRSKVKRTSAGGNNSSKSAFDKVSQPEQKVAAAMKKEAHLENHCKAD